MRSRVTAVFASVLVTGLLLVSPAHAAFPGVNGKIAYDDESLNFSPFGPPDYVSNIHTINPDGTGDVVISPPGAIDIDPAWSADGNKIAFVSEASSSGLPIFVMNADGSGRTQLTSGTNDVQPVWSPDDTKIAFRRCPPDVNCSNSHIYTMNADGSNQTRLTTNPVVDDFPSWSPDGTKIAFRSGSVDPQGVRHFDLWTIHPDGTGLTRLTTDGSFGSGLDWSPDGSKLLTVRGDHLATVSADGSVIQDSDSAFCAHGGAGCYIASTVWSPDGAKAAWVFSPGCFDTCSDDYPRLFTGDITAGPPGHIAIGNATWVRSYADHPSWQPIPLSYVRPRGATPFLTYLVPAYKPCTAPNGSHGSPLAFDSCNPPQQASSYLTLGTPDANNRPALTRGLVRYRVIVGSAGPPPRPSDLKIDVGITEVLTKATLAPYGGELAADAGVRITDKNNTPSPGGPGPGTVQDISFPVTVPCASGTCAVATSANAVMPGSVVQGMRAIWQLDQVKVYDGGADGLASTSGDNTLFMDEGIFVP
jgi:WD40-like Beta Propeller Repeat